MKVGYVGLGAMGRALAGRLVGAPGLLVWDINPRARAELAGRGAEPAASLADLGRRCDVVFLCLPKSANVHDALFAQGGLAGALAKGSTVIDQTSGNPIESRRFAQELNKRGISLIDAPVAGGVPSANAGQITIMASGPDAAFQHVRAILERISPKVFHCSARVGDGQAVKAINNLVNSGYRVSLLELLAIGRRCGLSAAAITKALNAGPGRSFVSGRLLPAIVERRASADFALGLMVKDLNQAAELAVSARIPMPLSDAARSFMNIALNLTGPEARLDDIVQFMERLTGTVFAEEGPVEPLAQADALDLVTGAAAACNRIVVLENILLARRLGLDLAAIAPVIAAGSAASAQAEMAFAALAGTGPRVTDAVEAELQVLTRTADLAAKLGIPALTVNQARSAYLAFLGSADPGSSLDDMVTAWLDAADHLRANA